MYDLSIEYQIDEFMIYCRSRELRAKTLESYEHTLRLFERWCNDELNITQVDQVSAEQFLCLFVSKYSFVQKAPPDEYPARDYP